jgi:hypothetical protein
MCSCEAIVNSHTFEKTNKHLTDEIRRAQGEWTESDIVWENMITPNTVLESG